MRTEVCGATNSTMMEVGGATSSMTKVRGYTKIILKVIRGIIGNFYLCGNRYDTVYFMMRRKLLHRIDGCVWSYQSYDNRGEWRSKSYDEGMWSY